MSAVQQVTEEDIREYGKEFSKDKDQTTLTEYDFQRADFFDADPDDIASRKELIKSGLDVAPMVPKDDFAETWKIIKGKPKGEEVKTFDRMIGDFYSDYITSDAKSPTDYIKRLSVPSDADLPTNFVKEEVEGYISPSMMGTVQDIADVYEVDGGYVLVGTIDQIDEAKRHVSKDRPRVYGPDEKSEDYISKGDWLG
jgi:hypothetical protein